MNACGERLVLHGCPDEASISSCAAPSRWMLIWLDDEPSLGPVQLRGFCRAHVLAGIGQLLDDPQIRSVTVAELEP